MTAVLEQMREERRKRWENVIRCEQAGLVSETGIGR